VRTRRANSTLRASDQGSSSRSTALAQRSFGTRQFAKRLCCLYDRERRIGREHVAGDGAAGLFAGRGLSPRGKRLSAEWKPGVSIPSGIEAVCGRGAVEELSWQCPPS
jgi:hypothetical protein